MRCAAAGLALSDVMGEPQAAQMLLLAWPFVPDPFLVFAEHRRSVLGAPGDA
jgi:hypothetical protein